MPILVYVENTAGKFKKSAYEVISYAKALGDKLNNSITALSIGEVEEEELKELGKYGVDKILNVNTEALKSFVNQAYAAVIVQATKEEGANIVVMANSFSGKSLAPRVAAKLEAGLADSVIELPQLTDNRFVVKKTAFSGKAFAFIELSSSRKVLTLAPNAYGLKEILNHPEIVRFNSETTTEDFGTMIKEIIQSTDKTPLPEAEIVVSGGRGLKGPENWGLIEQLAEALGAALACSKPVSDAGWRPHEEHVGQTGITISPNLYIAIGISGAIQHLAGVSASKVIVVINKDPEAPFFKVADYGIVGDAFEVVPKLTAAIKSLKEK